MSKQNKGAKDQKQEILKPTESKIVAPTAASTVKVQTPTNQELVFGAKNYYWIGGGFITMLVGFMLMSGGSMPSPDVWDESIIYSFRRITLAPFVILLGIAFQVVGIFSKK